MNAIHAIYRIGDYASVSVIVIQKMYNSLKSSKKKKDKILIILKHLDVLETSNPSIVNYV